jgi:Domain of unknown function (DUF4062)/NACHT domain
VVQYLIELLARAPGRGGAPTIRLSERAVIQLLPVYIDAASCVRLLDFRGLIRTPVILCATRERKPANPAYSGRGERTFQVDSVLKHHRAHVIRALRRAGFAVDPMEDWDSASDEPKVFCLERVEGCDLCVLLVGFRRGYRPDGGAMSITQMEYQHALRNGIDILPFLAKDRAGWDSRFDESETDEHLCDWRSQTMSRHGTGFFDSDPTTVEIAPSLTRWLSQRHERGRLKDYLAAIRDVHGLIRFVGLPQMKDDRDIRIDRLYVHPVLAQSYISPESGLSKWRNTESLLDVVAREQQLILLGDPGAGKSSLVSWIAWQLAQNGPNPWADRLGRSIPIPLVLRDLEVRPGVTWDQLLSSFLRQPMGKLLGHEKLESLLRGQNCIIFLDGLDEIGSIAVRRDLRDAVRDGMRRLPGCRWIFTSRVVGYNDVPFHEHVSGSKGSGDTGHARLSTWYVAPFNDVQVEEFATNWYTEREASPHSAAEGARNFLAAIYADDATTKLARTPNLLTIMALVFRVRARLPHGKALLYSEISQAYLETIENYRKLRESDDSLAEKKRWLSRVGFEMQRRRAIPSKSDQKRKSGKERDILAEGDDLRRWILEGMASSGKGGDEDDARQFVEYIKRRSGLMIERAGDRFAFTHLSFQEYFAACYLAEHTTSPDWLGQGGAGGFSSEDLQDFARNPLWHETLIFVMEQIAAERPAWHRILFESIFGRDWRDTPAVKENELSFQLLSRLGSNPHAVNDAAQRAQIVRESIRWEIARQAQLIPSVKLSTRLPQVVQPLFAGSARGHDANLQILREILEEAKAQVLRASAH